MRVYKSFAIIALASTVLQAEDFSLTQNGIGPITVHSELAYEGSGVRLVATMKNDSSKSVAYADLCVKASPREGCLFEMQNKDSFEPGAVLRFNVINADHVPSLAHQVTIKALNLSTVQATPLSAGVSQGLPSLPPASTQRGGLTNETILKLVKAGLGEDVIIGMVNSQPGEYAVDSDSVIAMKQSGTSDRIISAIVSKGTSPAASPAMTLSVPTSRPASNEPFVLHDGTPVRLRLARNLSSADAKTGEGIDFEVLDDVLVDDVILVKRGAVANGTRYRRGGEKTNGPRWKAGRNNRLYATGQR
jgi:hypothetical protein